jgi:hypothetical protein
MRERIPKRIIQTSKSAELSLLARATTSSLLHNPDFVSDTTPTRPRVWRLSGAAERLPESRL